MLLNTPLTNLQMELLELYTTELTETDLYELKRLLALFYTRRAIQQADQIWEERQLSAPEMENWLNEVT